MRQGDYFQTSVFFKKTFFKVKALRLQLPLVVLYFDIPQISIQ